MFSRGVYWHVFPEFRAFVRGAGILTDGVGLLVARDARDAARNAGNVRDARDAG